jgi:hypothetical protein
MFNLDKFLKKFKNLKPLNNEIKINLVNIIKNEINISININNISFKNNIIYIKTKPIYKNEIFINKNKILTLLNNNSKNIIKDIK